MEEKRCLVDRGLNMSMSKVYRLDVRRDLV